MNKIALFCVIYCVFVACECLCPNCGGGSRKEKRVTDEETRAEAGTQLGAQQNVDQQQAAQQAFDSLGSGRKKRQQGFKLGGRKKRQQGFKLGRGK
uniref:Secreted protein n=1 Tax=Acrobeloides nanus TaxID=290746 RepID=A0A914DSV9_9BILA